LADGLETPELGSLEVSSLLFELRVVQHASSVVPWDSVSSERALEALSAGVGG
jgi:hypothetical protein